MPYVLRTRSGQTKVPAFLASVTSAAEARIALENGADVIDAKDPSQGALGALPSERIREIVKAVDGAVPVSATVGDLPCEPVVLSSAVLRTAATGVSIVKVGLFGAGGHEAAISALGRLDLQGAKLACVMMADQDINLRALPALVRAGFAIVMLDTADKTSGSLRAVADGQTLRGFLSAARDCGLVAGLAGSLRLSDIGPLSALEPDILGFRGELCLESRTGALQASRVAAVKAAIGAAPAKSTGNSAAGIERFFA